MSGSTARGSRLATLEELIDAGELRGVIAAGLVQPIDAQAVRRAVWAYVCASRDVGTPPGRVILDLTSLVEASAIAPRAVRDDMVRRVILWCVDAYFGQIGERVDGDRCAGENIDVTLDSERPLPPVRVSNR